MNFQRLPCGLREALEIRASDPRNWPASLPLVPGSALVLEGEVLSEGVHLLLALVWLDSPGWEVGRDDDRRQTDGHFPQCFL